MYAIAFKNKKSSEISYFAGVFPIIDSNETTVVSTEEIILGRRYNSIEETENEIKTIQQRYKSIMKEPIEDFIFEIHKLTLTTNKVK